MLYRSGYRGPVIGPRLPFVSSHLLKLGYAAALAATPVLFSPTVSAGKITLNNGDVLHGEMTGINTEAVLWRSESFGAQRINKTKIDRNLNAAENPRP